MEIVTIQSMTYLSSIESSIYSAISPVGIMAFTDGLDIHYSGLRSYHELRGISTIIDTTSAPVDTIDSASAGFRRGSVLAILFAFGYLREDSDHEFANIIREQKVEMMQAVPSEHYLHSTDELVKSGIRKQIRERADQSYPVDYAFARAIAPHLLPVIQYGELTEGIFTGLHFTLNCTRRNRPKIQVVNHDTLSMVAGMVQSNDQKIDTELYRILYGNES